MSHQKSQGVFQSYYSSVFYGNCTFQSPKYFIHDKALLTVLQNVKTALNVNVTDYYEYHKLYIQKT